MIIQKLYNLITSFYRSGKCGYRCITPFVVLCFGFLSLNQVWGQISFTPSDLVGEIVSNPTSLQFGPDGRLYVSQQDGLIYAFTIQRSAANNYSVTDTETIDLVKTKTPNFNDDGSFNASLERQVTGLYITGTSSNPVLYVGSSDMRIGAGGGGSDSGLDTNSGVISRLTWDGSSWEKVDLVRGLPRSEENHSINGLLIDPANPADLYLAYGGNTNAGAPSSNFAFLSEFAYSNAILKIDLDAIDNMPVNTSSEYGYELSWVYDLPTLDDPTRPNINGIDDPNQAGYDGVDPGDPFGGNDGLNQAKIDASSPVQIHSPGWRNAYDLVITTTPGREGRMYAVDNGANPDWGGHPEGEADYPGDVTIAMATGNYLPGEPGSLGPGPGGDPVVNNLNGLHYIRPLVPGDLNYVPGDPFSNQVYYAGHPNPIRANPLGAGLFTKGPHTVDPLDGGDDFWRTQVLSVTDPDFAAQSLPVDWPPVPEGQANPAEGDFRNAGETDGALAVFSQSTNGICEYTATNFEGEMTGDLIMAGFNGSIFRAILNDDGTQVLNCPNTPTTCTSTIASGFGELPLDVIALGDGDVFPGTIWTVTFGSGKITIFEPVDYDGVPPSPCNANILSYQQDSDGDNYTDGDENDNGSDPCSAASQPVRDFDQTFIGGFLVSDLNDPDDDDDGLPDLVDAFVWDPANGMDLVPPLFNDLFNEQGVGIGGIGFTGLMANGTTPYHEQYDPNAVILGGTSGLLTIPSITSGDAFVNNLQDNSFQFGVNVSSDTGPFTVKTKINGPFFNNITPVNWQSQGFYIGTGDQNNYLKLVLTANNGVGGFQVFQENDGAIADAPNGEIAFDINGLLAANSIELYLWVDPANGSVQPRYSLDEGVVNDLGGLISLQGNLLEVVQGNYLVNGQTSALAVGVIATSFNNQPEFTGTWDYFDITVDNEPPTNIQVDPIADQTSQEGDQPVLTAVATGGSANLNYSAVGLPSGLTIEPTNGQIIGTIDTGASAGGASGNGIHLVTITVDDAGLNPDVSVSFNWTVLKNLDIWTSITNNNEHIPRHENSLAQLGDKFYLLGGRESDQVEIYDYQLDTWSSGATAPTTIHHFQAVAYQGYIWAITGFQDNDFPNEQPADSVFLYDPVQDQWLTGPAIPDSRKRGSAGVVVYQDKFYVVGGIQNGHSDGWVPWFDEYDPSTNTWTELPDAPQARDHFHAVIVGDKLYLTGGRRSGEIDTFSPTIPEVDVFDFISGTWQTSNLPNDLPTPRAGAAAVEFQGQVVVIGGEGDNTAYDQTNALDIVSGEWTSLAPLNNARHGTQAIVSGDGIHITSGSPNQGNGTMNNMEVYGLDNPTGTAVSASGLTGPASVDFGAISGTMSVILNSTNGNQGIALDSIFITGVNAGDFSIGFVDQFKHILIPADGSLDVNIDFIPLGTGSRTADLVAIFNGNSQITVSLTADITTSCVWENGPAPSESKFEAQIATINGKIYIFPGFTFNIDISNLVEVYDPVTSQWTTLSPMPTAVTHVDNVVVGDEVWFVGGFIGDSPGPATDEVQIYNTLTDTWTTGPALPAPRGSVAMALIDQNIHAFGGLLPDRNTDTGEHYVLDLDNQQLGWQPLADMPVPRNHHAGVTIDGLIYAIGGQTAHDSGNAADLDVVHVYDPAIDQWTQLSDLPQPRSHIEPGSFAYQGNIIIAGGRDGVTYLNTILSYDPGTDSWSELCEMPLPLNAPSTVVVGGKLHLISGGMEPTTAPTPQDSHYITTLSLEDQVPLASAGANQSIILPVNSVSLSGAGSDPDGGNIVTYSWTQQSGPSNATLSGDNSANLTASDLIEGIYVLRLTVTDDEGETGFDEVVVDVNSGQAPIADAGADQTIIFPTNSLVLNGGGNDPDGGNIISYLWEQQSGPSTATLSGTNTADLTASDLIEGDYIFRLTVTDDEGATGFDETSVTVNAANSQGVFSFTLIDAVTNQAVSGYDPISNDATIDLLLLGTDQLNIRANTNPETVGSVIFDLSGFDGGSDNQRTENAAPYALFGDAAGDYNSWTPTAPQSGYSYSLNAIAYSESRGNGSILGALTIDFSFVTDGNTSQPPTVDAGSDQIITLPVNSVNLNGSGDDPDGGSIADYTWTQQSGPSTASLNGENTANLTANDLIEGSYVFRLTLTDDEAETGFDEVVVTVNPGQVPTVIAGEDQVIILPVSTIVLNGTGSDPDGGSVSYLWSQQAGPNDATLSGEGTQDLSASDLIAGTYTFRLTVTDDEGEIAFDDVVVTVNTQQPVADAGEDQNLILPDNSITLNGMGNDPDGGTITEFAWNQISGPSIADLSGSNSANLTVSNLVEGDYLFQLTVTDDEGETASDEAMVAVTQGQLPTANAGPDQTITLPTNSVTLSGSASDPDGGVIVDYVWSQQSGPDDVTLAGENTSVLSATELTAGFYVFRLTVTDDEGATVFDEATVSVLTQLPLADAGEDQTILLPISSVTLNGSGNDPDGGTITSYAWTQQSGPSTADLTGENTADLAASNLVEGGYVFRLTVTDDEGETAFDEATVTVSSIPQDGVFSFTLIDANTDQPIAGYDPIADGVTIDLSTLPTDQLNIRANTNPATVGSVSFILQGLNGGTDYLRTENGGPYALFGDTAGDYVSWIPDPPEPGFSYNLTGTAYDARNGGGSVLGSFTITFSFIDDGVVNNPPIVTNPGTQNSVEGDNISLLIVANDGDQGDQNLTYQATNLPPGLTIDPTTGVISGVLSTGSTNPGYQENNGLVIVESESATLTSNWIQGTDAGVTYYQATQDNFNDPSAGGILNYDIVISTTGIYRFEWISKINQGDSHTDSNDNWLRFPNNEDVVFFGYQGTVTSEFQLETDLQNETNVVFPIGSGLEGAQTTPNGAGGDGFFKVFMNTLNNWVWSAKTSDNDGHQIFVKFNNAGTYSMELSNRSAGHAIDRMALYKIDTYGDNYDDTSLTDAEPSSSDPSGASANSPYQVEVTVVDDGTPASSSLISFTWNVDTDPQSTSTLDLQSEFPFGAANSRNTDLFVRVYPNPVGSDLNVSMNLVDQDLLSFSLFSVTGREMNLGDRQASAGASIFTFDTRKFNLTTGSYYLKIKSSTMKSVLHYKLLIR